MCGTLIYLTDQCLLQVVGPEPPRVQNIIKLFEKLPTVNIRTATYLIKFLQTLAHEGSTFMFKTYFFVYDVKSFGSQRY